VGLSICSAPRFAVLGAQPETVARLEEMIMILERTLVVCEAVLTRTRKNTVRASGQRNVMAAP